MKRKRVDVSLATTKQRKRAKKAFGRRAVRLELGDRYGERGDKND